MKMTIYTVPATLLLILLLAVPIQASASTSAGTKPGDIFYFIDTTFEKVDLFLTFNSEKKAGKILGYAQERFEEAKELATENKPNQVANAIENYGETIDRAIKESQKIKSTEKEEELLSKISESTTIHQDILKEVLNTAPAEAKESIDKAIETVAKIHETTDERMKTLKAEVDDLKAEIIRLQQELKKEDSSKSVVADSQDKENLLKKDAEAQEKAQRLAEEQRAEKQRLEQEQIAAQQRQAEAQRQEEQEKAQRLAEEQRAEKQRLEQEQIAAQQRQAEAQRQEEQEKTNRTNNLIAEYNSKKASLEQQIITLKSQYYEDVEKEKNRTVSMATIQGGINKLTNDVNFEIQKISNEIDQLYLEYQSRINSL